MKNRILSILLCLVLCIGLLQVTVPADYEETEEETLTVDALPAKTCEGDVPEEKAAEDCPVIEAIAAESLPEREAIGEDHAPEAIAPIAETAAYQEGDIPGTYGTGTESDPVVCDSFKELRDALQHTGFQYVQLDDVPKYSHKGDIPAPEASYPSAAICISPNLTKTLILNGDAVFTELNSEGSFLYVEEGAKLILMSSAYALSRGKGSLKLIRCAHQQASSLVTNLGNLTVYDGVTLETEGDAGSCFSVRQAKGSLTIYGGKYLASYQSAVVLEGGSTRIQGGLFRGAKQDREAIDIYSGTQVTIAGGVFYGFRMPAGKTVYSYLPDSATVSAGPDESTIVGLGNVISVVGAEDLEPPQAGQPFDFSVSRTGGHYSVQQVGWRDNYTQTISQGDTCKPGRTCTAIVTYAANSGWRFSGRSQMIPTLSNVTADYTAVITARTDSSVTVEYRFERVSGPIPRVDFTVQNPAHGFHPQKAESNSSCVKVLATTWTTGGQNVPLTNTFKAGKTYTVKVEAMAYGGCSFSSPIAWLNGSTVSGTVTEWDNTYVTVTASFTVPEAEKVTAITVRGYQEMRVDATSASTFEFNRFPSLYHAEGVQLAGWETYCDTDGAFISENKMFEPGKTYLVRVDFIPIPGYTIDKNCTLSFGSSIGTNSISRVYNDGSKAEIWSARVTMPTEIQKISILGYRLPVIGKTIEENYEFDLHSAEYAAQGLQLTEWYVVRREVNSTGSWSATKKTDVIEADYHYKVHFVFKPLPGFVLKCYPAFEIDGGGRMDLQTTCLREECGIWAAKDVPGTGVLPAFTVNHSCTLNECLELNYYIPVSALDGYDNVKMTVQYERFDGDTRTLSEEKTLTPTTVTMSGAQRYRFSFKGIAAAEIGSRIYATVTAEKNGIVFRAEEPDVYSIADYCYAVLGSSSMSDSLKTLCVDTLNYGAAAQTHFNVNPGKLCNADLTNAQKARSVGDVTLHPCNSTAAYAGTVKASFVGRSYVLNNAPELKLRIIPSSGVDASRLTVKYTYTRADKTVAAGSLTPELDGGDGWVVRLNTVAGPDLRSPITFIICEGTKQVSGTLTFSAEGYCYAMTNSSTAKQTLKDLCRAMMRFSEAARRHFG